MTMLTLKGTEQAAKDFGDWSGCARIMIDLADGEVWTDVFADSNNFKNYHADTIVCLTGKYGLRDRNERISDERLKKYCNKIQNLYKKVLAGEIEKWELEVIYSDWNRLGDE